MSDASIGRRLASSDSGVKDEPEPVAWADKYGETHPITAESKKTLSNNPTTEPYWSRFSIPLYAAHPTNAGMREALERCATICERRAKQCRRAADNPEMTDAQQEIWAALCNENLDNARAFRALTAPGATTKSDGGGERFIDSAYQIAEEMRKEDRPSDPSPTRSDVTALTKRIDQVLKVMRGARNRSEPMAVWADDIKAIEDARARLETHEIRRRQP